MEGKEENKNPSIHGSDDEEESEEEITQEEKDTTLLEFARQDNYEEVEQWLDKGGDPLFEAEGWNAVLWAACNGNEKMLRLLYRRGALQEYIGEPNRGAD